MLLVMLQVLLCTISLLQE